MKITPVFRESAAAVESNLGKVQSDEPIEFKKDGEPINIDSEATCLQNTPLMIGLCIAIVAMFVPVGVLIRKIKNLNKEANETEIVNFESTQSK